MKFEFPRRVSQVAVATAMTFALGTAAVAENHVIQAKGVKFDPMFLYIQPGDTVSFERMPSHNVETLDPMVPEGQEKIMSELGDNITVTFDTVGIVSYKCTPHWGNRMGGFIVVGEPENPGEIIDSYMAVTEEQKEYLPARGLLKKLRVDMEKNGMIGAPES